MDMKLEVVVLPVSDVDRAKDFYTRQLGFRLDADFPINDGYRIIQVTPPVRPARSSSATASPTPNPARSKGCT
ncbi:VOC family protein [Nonomuraea recticatena]|uniref:VOC family protein n=1 Tax=Nonomuraea recticatena TaxID=46178 RepID=UPI0036121F82